MLLNLTILPGDGIGPEVTAEAVRVLEAVATRFSHQLQLTTKPIGGAALDATAATTPDALPHDTIEACLASSAVLLGAVGDPKFDANPPALRPEAGLLRLRKALGAYANLRPAICFPSLAYSSPLRAELVAGTDILIVRELLSGIYFGQPRHTEGHSPNRIAVDTMRYTEFEIERIARMAFDLARQRSKKLLSVDKANVLDSSRLWRSVVTRISADYPEVHLAHQYVDSCAMLLAAKPTQFDVILTENMFGDILSDLAGAVVGSLGLLASASIGGPVGLYEPVHGSAPDIAGEGIANPLGAIFSAAMMLRHSFSLEAEAAAIESAVQKTLNSGARTRDLAQAGQAAFSTGDMGQAIADAIAAPPR